MENGIEKSQTGQWREPPASRRLVPSGHKFIDLLVIAICATLCGASDWNTVEQFGRAKAAWLGSFLELPNGIPASDTLWRIFRFLNTACFERCFAAWVATLQEATAREQTLLDDELLVRSPELAAGKAAIHLVSAWVDEHQLVLRPSTRGKDQQADQAIPALLACLRLRNCVVATDTINCPAETVQTILTQQADYLLALKENYLTLSARMACLFEEVSKEVAACAHANPYYDYTTQVEKGAGRIEVYKAWTITSSSLIAALPQADAWPQLATFIKVHVEQYLGDYHSCATYYYLSSATGTADQFLSKIRVYFSPENGLDWVLDTTFAADVVWPHQGGEPETFAILRRMALNLLKQDHSHNRSIKNKRLRAGWDHAYLLSLLTPLFHQR